MYRHRWRIVIEKLCLFFLDFLKATQIFVILSFFLYSISLNLYICIWLNPVQFFFPMFLMITLCYFCACLSFCTTFNVSSFQRFFLLYFSFCGGGFFIRVFLSSLFVCFLSLNIDFLSNFLIILSFYCFLIIIYVFIFIFSFRLVSYYILLSVNVSLLLSFFSRFLSNRFHFRVLLFLSSFLSYFNHFLSSLI